MQFPVPQFTDVEDKIIGILTFKQFGILFAAGILVFLVFSMTKNIPSTVVGFVIFGLPALIMAFAKINGRPMYSAFKYFFRFLSSPKLLIFHKEAERLSSSAKLKDVQFKKSEEAVVKSRENTQTRLEEVQKLLRTQEAEEEEITKKLK